jgi:hypothetical protein
VSHCFFTVFKFFLPFPLTAVFGPSLHTYTNAAGHSPVIGHFCTGLPASSLLIGRFRAGLPATLLLLVTFVRAAGHFAVIGHVCAELPATLLIGHCRALCCNWSLSYRVLHSCCRPICSLVAFMSCCRPLCYHWSISRQGCRPLCCYWSLFSYIVLALPLECLHVASALSTL